MRLPKTAITTELKNHLYPRVRLLNSRPKWPSGRVFRRGNRNYKHEFSATRSVCALDDRSTIYGIFDIRTCTASRLNDETSKTLYVGDGKLIANFKSKLRVQF